MDKLEHGIVLLKPDGVEQNLENELYEQLNKRDLIIIETNKTFLMPDDVEKNIRTSFDTFLYSNYMCSGPVVSMMVKGEYAIDKLIQIKRNIRTHLGVTCNDMKNYIHSADLGNEHYIQTKYFFPNLDANKYGLYADMTIPISDNDLNSQIKTIENNSNVSCIGLLIDSSKLPLGYLKIKKILDSNLNIIYGIRFNCKVRLNVKEELIITIIGYFINIDSVVLKLKSNLAMNAQECIKTIHSLKGISVLDYYPLNEKTYDLLKMLKTWELDGAVVYDLRYTLEEVAKLEYIAADVLGLLLVGGSHGQICDGTLSIDKKTFDIFFCKMNEYNNKIWKSIK